MASIHKKPSRASWLASYRDAEGRQHLVSTKIEHTPPGKDVKERAVNASTNRRLAQEMATRLEEAERGNATEVHWRKLLGDISERVNKRRLEFKIVEPFLNDWLARAEKTKSAGTHERYKGIVNNFVKSLGTKAKAALSDVTVQDVQKFIEWRLEGGRNPSTVRTDCKILNAPFALALRQGLILSNPVAAAEIPEGAKESRAPFTPEQIGDLLKATDALARQDKENEAMWREWRTCILVGFFTGARLGDAVGMTVGHFDFDQHTLKMRPQKTSRMKRDLIIPLHPNLEAHVLDLPRENAKDVSGWVSGYRNSLRSARRATIGCCVSTSMNAYRHGWKRAFARLCKRSNTMPGACLAATGSSDAGWRTARVIPIGRCGCFTGSLQTGAMIRFMRRSSPRSMLERCKAICCMTRPKMWGCIWPSRIAIPVCTPRRCSSRVCGRAM